MGAVYSQLSIEERRRIERWRHAKVPVREMARVLWAAQQLEPLLSSLTSEVLV
jgi:IS30 family transposase